MHPFQKAKQDITHCAHFINGQPLNSAPTSSSKKIASPYTGLPMATYDCASVETVNLAVSAAKKASETWGKLPHKERAQVLFQFRNELYADLEKITFTKSFESGKTLPEAKAGLMKGIEVLEFALSLQNLDVGGKLEVSKGVHCEYRRIPMGVVAGITPFNFPAMVPMWMMPIAIALGNAFIWKPSDKTPMTSLLIADCFKRAGLPDGVLNILQGGKETVESIIDHPDVSAIGFVGSTPIAKEVYKRGTSQFKKVLALGGAKNHIILLPDANIEMAAQGISDSFTGCAGQRCMAASVLLTVGNVDPILSQVIEKTKHLVPGRDIGAMITKAQVEFLRDAIDQAEKEGAKVVLDGRKCKPPAEFENGNFIGPTILDNVRPGSMAATRELFGPILSIIRCKDLSEALQIEKSNPYGNATSVFTQNGALAEQIVQSATSGMIGINIGVPVPREPFSFGGIFESKFGTGDITGMHSLNHWSELKKVTTKWAIQKDSNWMS